MAAATDDELIIPDIMRRPFAARSEADMTITKIVIFQKLKVLFLAAIIGIVVAATFAGITLKDKQIEIANRFGIEGDYSFVLSQGDDGRMKTDFSFFEKQIVLDFIISLTSKNTTDNGKSDDSSPAIPENLFVYMEHSRILFHLQSCDCIQVSQFNQGGDLISLTKFATTTKQLKNMYSILSRDRGTWQI